MSLRELDRLALRRMGRWFKLGHALNVFLRRSHGAGHFRDDDVYFEHFVQCGIEANLEGWGGSIGDY